MCKIGQKFQFQLWSCLLWFISYRVRPVCDKLLNYLLSWRTIPTGMIYPSFQRFLCGLVKYPWNEFTSGKFHQTPKRGLRMSEIASYYFLCVCGWQRLHSDRVTGRSRSQAWIATWGPEPSHTAVWASVLAKFARLWLTLFWITLYFYKGIDYIATS